MPRTVTDKATPTTGGVKNHAHKKRIARKACLHKFNPPVLLSSRSFAKTEPGPFPHRPNYAKRTQLPPPRGIPSGGLRSEAQRPKVEGPVQSASPKAIPNKPPAHQKRETNPICPHGHPAPPQKLRNEPNLHRDGPVEHQKNETNPICRPATPPSAPNEPNLRPAHDQKNETNPIPVPLASRRPPQPPTIHHSPRTSLFYETNPISNHQLSAIHYCLSTISCLPRISLEFSCSSW